MTYEKLPDEWKEWVDLTPLERFRRSQKIFTQYLAMGGSLDTDFAPTSPFDFPETSGAGLLMGGQACVFYGAAQFSKNIDFVFLAGAGNFDR